MCFRPFGQRFFQQYRQKRTLWAPHRCVANIRSGDFCGAVDEALCKQRQGESLDGDEAE
jgi:hypothetical protein